ncbi:MAG: diguanylate cyclase [Fibrobacterales bacterium]
MSEQQTVIIMNDFEKSQIPLKMSRLPWGVLIVVIVSAIILDVSFSKLLSSRTALHHKTEVTEAVSGIKGRLEGKINSNMFLLYGMAAFISVRDTFQMSEFNHIAEDLLKQGTSLQNIAVAPDFIISFVYPLEGNKKVLGMNYRKVPAQWEQAKQAKETGKMTLAGPIPLIQGGKGLVARIPVFRERDGKFWGLVSAVMDFDELFSDVHELQNNVFSIAARGVDGKGAEGNLFYGDSTLFNSERGAVLSTIALPTGEWEMAVLPMHGWLLWSPYSVWVHITVLLLTGLLGTIVIIRHKSNVALIIYEARLNAMSKASRDPIVIIDKDDLITFWNPAATMMFGYGQKEVIGSDFKKMISVANGAGTLEPIDFWVKGTGMAGGEAVVEARMKMGKAFKAGLSLSPFEVFGEKYIVVTIRDITAQYHYEQKLEGFATKDALTGLNNRRHFWELAEREVKRSVRYQNAVSIVMLDIDHFKNVNDTYGHAAGDLILKEVSRVFIDILRTTDIVGRVGGEEFALLLPETGTGESLQVIERIRTAVEETQVVRNDQSMKVTISAGVVDGSFSQNLEDLMNRADALLYEAKQSGRNKVVVHN